MITRTAVILSLLAGPALAGSPVNERRPAAPDGVVRIENPAGSIKVVTLASPRASFASASVGLADQPSCLLATINSLLPRMP